MKRLSTRLVSTIGLAAFSLVPPAHAEDAPPTDGPSYAECSTYDDGMVVEGDGTGGDVSGGFEGDPDIYVDPAPEDSSEAYVEESAQEVPAEEYPSTEEPVCYQVVPVESCDTCEAYATDGHDATTGAPVAAESGPVSAPVEPTSATVDDVTPAAVDAPAAPAPAVPVAPAPAAALAAGEPAPVAAPALPRAALAEVEVTALADEVPALQASA